MLTKSARNMVMNICNSFDCCMHIKRNSKQRDNCFTLLRYLFFLSIFCNHYYVINGCTDTLFRGIWLVQGFFIISGVIVFNSFERSKNLKEFFLKRFFRIYPAYFIAVVSCFAMGIVVTTMPIGDFLSCKTSWKYLVANLCFSNFMQPTLPGVFEGNPQPYINASLWTLKVEIMFYLSLPIVVYLMKHFNRDKVLWTIIIFSILWDVATSQLFGLTGIELFERMNRQIFGQLSYFFFPVWLYAKRNELFKRWWLFAVSLLGIALQLWMWEITYVNCFFFTITIFFVAYKAKFLFGISNVTDYSYEMYLVRFPVLQILCMCGMAFDSITAVVALVIISILAYFLHNVCEKISYKNLFNVSSIHGSFI